MADTEHHIIIAPYNGLSPVNKYPMKKYIREDEKVSLLLSKTQIELIREHTFAEFELPDVFIVSETSGNKQKVWFTLHDLDHLNGYIAAAANHCEDKKLQRKLDALYDTIQRVEQKYEIKY